MKTIVDFLTQKQHGEQTHKYLVKVTDVKGMDLYFNTRNDAREYKAVLRRSCRGLEAKIMRQDFDGDYMLGEEVVS